MGKLIDKETMLKSVSDIKAEWGNDNLSLINQAEVLDLIEEQPTVDAVPVVHAHWIPCSERSPGEDEYEVLACDMHENELIGHVYKDRTSNTGYTCESDECAMRDCIAWMPLPAPYKERKHD